MELTMSENTLPAAVMAQSAPVVRTQVDSSATFAILVSLSVCHMLNDLNQSLVPALYPILKQSYRLDFAQIGLITLAFQLTASMLQPVVGLVTDRRRSRIRCPLP
jgi:FSR family fosmidomycin resistance protein-like MFS transporter